MMNVYLFEFIGTALLILLGNGVVANVSLKNTYGFNAGLIVITFGWAIGVFVGVFVSADASGGHLNPAVTLGLATAGKFSWQMVPGYVFAQVLGAMMGSLLVWLTYKKHYDTTEDPGAIRGTFSTGPAIDKPLWNFITELIGTFVLVFSVFYIAGGTLGDEPISLGSLDALPVGLVVLGIGLSLGGPTGYAINPARDLGPRIMHTLLPIKAKGDSNWKYAWIPVLGPITGGVLAALIYMAISM
jgi:glycerol uptake facilitator